MTTADIARWFVAKRGVSEIKAIALADAVVIRRTFKPERARKGQTLLPFVSHPTKGQK